MWRLGWRWRGLLILSERRPSLADIIVVPTHLPVPDPGVHMPSPLGRFAAEGLQPLPQEEIAGLNSVHQPPPSWRKRRPHHCRAFPTKR